MSTLENVTIIKKANVYFDGKVTSRTVVFADGSEKSLGIMLPGEYKFNTGKAEIMEILAGELTIKLAEEDEWKTIEPGTSFDVPANSSFELKISQLTDYCCEYID